MTYPSMPYIKYATENYINPKFNLAKSDVSPPDFEKVMDNHAFYSHLKNDAYSLLKMARSLLAKRYDVEENNVEFTIGVTNAFSSLAQLAKSMGGKRIISESPGYEPFWLTPIGHGLEVSFINRNKVDFGFDLKEILSTVNEGDWLWISNPHNPSGRHLELEEINAIAKALQSKNAYLFVDEIYLDFISPLGEDSCALIQDNVIISSSLTKAYGLGGLKIGWVIGSADLIEQMTINRLHQFMLTPSSSMAMLLSMWDRLDLIRKESVEQVRERVGKLKKILDSSLNIMNESIPINFMRLERHPNDIEFSKTLNQANGVIVAPGSFFNSPGFIRVSAAGKDIDIQEGAKILKSFL